MFFLSWRQLMSKKKQTLLILFGISLGTLLFIAISGIQLGMRKYISEQLLNNTAHIVIRGRERQVSTDEVTEAFFGAERRVHWVNAPAGLREQVKLENYSGWYDLLNRDKRVLDFSPRIAAHVVISNGKFNSAINLIGTIPERQVRISTIERYMLEGSFSALKGANNIVLGSGTVEDLGIKLGQNVMVKSAEGQRPFRLVGIFSFGNEQVDHALAFGNLPDIQILTKSPGRVSEIAVALLDIEDSKKLAQEWKLLSHDKVEDWQEANKSFMEMIRVQDFTRYFITLAVLAVSSFGIYNVLSIMINQKKKEIAILQAIGYGPDKILKLVLYQGLVLGIGGGILGLILGHSFCKWIESIELDLMIGNANHLLIDYDWKIYVGAFLSAFCSALLAAYIPARSASKMSPMDVIRGEG